MKFEPDLATGARQLEKRRRFDQARTNWTVPVGDKGNTASESELMLTYRTDGMGSLIGPKRRS
ncbi:hypothetical protein BC6307_03630 [Sutcliffiella cohnii]|uniref:Uncharacterized protein n=1 Tax=Sutcliffiella cohnii TaxID=33932 RepID=A0A223KLZ8_9BACI|nr:hypothetical protein BC6307_03630 [Sutcliffiella cohnii]